MDITQDELDDMFGIVHEKVTTDSEDDCEENDFNLPEWPIEFSKQLLLKLYIRKHE